MPMNIMLHTSQFTGSSYCRPCQTARAFARAPITSKGLPRHFFASFSSSSDEGFRCFRCASSSFLASACTSAGFLPTLSAAAAAAARFRRAPERVHGTPPCLERDEQGADDQELLRGELPERKQNQRTQSVRIQDVAPKKQECVRQAEQEQPKVPPVVDVGGGGPGALLDPRGQQDHAGSEDHREEAPHLALDQDAKQRPTGQV